MQMTDVVAKTAKGTEEIKTRANKLSQQLRWLLIMVDGRLTVGALLDRCKSLGNPQALLSELISGGYVEVHSGAGSAAPELKAPPGFEEAVCELTAMLNQIMGPDADLFAAPMESAKTRQQYLTALENARQTIERLYGAAKATHFAERGRAIADKFLPAA